MALICQATLGAAQTSHAGAPARPSLVVLISVDQMQATYYDRFKSQLTGGLARLYRGGAVFTSAWHDQAITQTAPGHAAMLTGRFPRSTGIINDTLGAPDEQETLVGGGGGGGASPYRLRGSALLDWMRNVDPKSRAFAVSRKNRSAILPVGRSHQEVFWYANDGRFTTSTYYADTLPTWVQQFNARKITSTYAGKTWTLLRNEREYPEPDSVPIENAGRDFTFPHAISSDPARAARDLIYVPAMDSMTVEFALAGVSALRIGAGPHPDLLVLGLSTTDAVGHRWGPDSRELHDQILRLDGYLGTFIDSLYKLRDSSRVVFVLTADHGMAPFTEVHAAQAHVAPRRVTIAPIVAAAAAKLPRSGDTASILLMRSIVTLDRAALVAAHVDPDSVTRALRDQLRAVPGVMRVDLVRDLARADTVRDAIARRWVHALPPDFPAVLAITLEPYAQLVNDREAQHGSPHDYDAHVPLVFYGAGIAPGTFARRALVVDIAPTLAAMLGVAPTERLDGHILREIVKR